MTNKIYKTSERTRAYANKYYREHRDHYTKLRREYRRKYPAPKIEVSCPDCGKIRLLIRRSHPEYSKQCRGCAKRRFLQNHTQPIMENAYNWKGGKYTDKKYGYVMIWVGKEDFFFPMAQMKKNSGGYVPEHRLVMARHLGRCLHTWEIVHHKGTKYPIGSKDNKSDNRKENLQLIGGDKHNQITLLENKIRILKQQILKLKSERTY